MKNLSLFILMSFSCFACQEAKPPCNKPEYYTYLAMPSHEGAFEHYVHHMCCEGKCLSMENLYRVAVGYMDQVQVNKPISGVTIVDDPEGLAIDTDYWEDEAVTAHTLFSILLDKPYPTDTTHYIYAIAYRDTTYGLRHFLFPNNVRLGANIDLRQAIEMR